MENSAPSGRRADTATTAAARRAAATASGAAAARATRRALPIEGLLRRSRGRTATATVPGAVTARPSATAASVWAVANVTATVAVVNSGTRQVVRRVRRDVKHQRRSGT